VKILILSVGKPGSREADRLFCDYEARLGRLGVDCSARWVREVTPGGRYSDDHVREREAAALRKALPERRTVVAMDRGGTLLGSEDLSDRVVRWASPAATFVVGGPLGLHRSFVDESTAVWSLSPLTFPHELARVLVIEQLYRAMTLVRGVPYHK